MARKRVPAPVRLCFTIAVTSVILLYPACDASANAQTVCSGPQTDGALVLQEIGARLIVDSRTREWAQFQQLSREWKEKRGASSSITDMSMLEPYQRIIGMGESAIPLLIAQLRAEGDEPDQWFWALRVLTNANPVNAEDQGDFAAMAKAWIAWGETQGYAG